MKNASMRYSQLERFHKYVVLAQNSSRGTAGTQVRGEYIDQDVPNTGRVLVIQSETAANKKQADARAKWEGVVRAARAATMTVKLPTWSPVPGYIWTPGDLVPVVAPALRVSGQMMISTVGLTANDRDGTPAELTLVRPDAFSPLPIGERTWQE